MRVLITGAGLIGSYTAAEFAGRGHQVFLYDYAPSEEYVRSVVGEHAVTLRRGDVADYPSLAAVMVGERIECVIHTAGLIGGVAQRRPWDAIRTNVFGTVYVIEAARLAGATRLIYTTTHGVYDFDRCREAPITEESPTSDATIYGACKLSAEHLLRACGRAYEIDVIALRFTNIYGRGLYATGSVGGEHCNAMVEPVARGEPGLILPAVKGRGEWLYVKDAALALALAAERRERDGYLLACIGTGVLSTHDDIMAAVREAVPAARFQEVDTGPVERAPERPQPYDLTHARQTLGYVSQWDLRAGVADYLREAREVLGAQAARAG